MVNLAEVREELAEVLSSLQPVLEGLRDFGRLNLSAEAARAVIVATEDFNRRVRLVQSALAAVEDLLRDGHPEMPRYVVDGGTLENLREQSVTIEAALERFGMREEAVEVVLVPGALESK